MRSCTVRAPNTDRAAKTRPESPPGLLQGGKHSISPPEDKSICTLWVGGVDQVRHQIAVGLRHQRDDAALSSPPSCHLFGCALPTAHCGLLFRGLPGDWKELLGCGTPAVASVWQWAVGRREDRGDRGVDHSKWWWW